MVPSALTSQREYQWLPSMREKWWWYIRLRSLIIAQAHGQCRTAKFFGRNRQYSPGNYYLRCPFHEKLLRSTPRNRSASNRRLSRIIELRVRGEKFFARNSRKGTANARWFVDVRGVKTFEYFLVEIDGNFEGMESKETFLNMPDRFWDLEVSTFLRVPIWLLMETRCVLMTRWRCRCTLSRCWNRRELWGVCEV